MDRDRSAQVHNVEIKRDRVTITLAGGVIQFVKPANGVVFGAVFYGSGRLQRIPQKILTRPCLQNLTEFRSMTRKIPSRK
jgi:hypothetical protein